MEKEARLTMIFILVYLAVILFIFLPALEGDFLWDDKLFISENPNILGSDFLKNFLTSPFGGVIGLDERSIELNRKVQFYRPITSLSYWLDFKVWELNPAGFHLTNVLIHLVNTILLYFILLQLGVTRISAFSSGLLFALFPLHFENVSWITGRTDLLSFLFVTLSVLFFIKFFKKEKYSSLITSSVFFLLALLSKENSLMVIAIYFFFVWQKGFGIKKSIVILTPSAVSVVIWFILRRIAIGSLVVGYSGRTLFDLFAAIGFYSFKTVIPFNLSYTIDSSRVFHSTFFALIGGILTFGLVALILTLLSKRQSPHIKWQVGPVAFYLLLLPSVLVIFSSTTVSYMGWRFLYLPSAVFVSYLSYFLFKNKRANTIPVIVISLMCLLYGAEIYPKNKSFGQSESDFWLGIRHIQKEDISAKINIAQQLLYRDENKALAVYKNILQQKEHHLYGVFQIRIYEELASFYTYKKDLKKAEEYFNRLFQIQDTQSQFFHFTYATFLAYKGELGKGEKIVTEMLRMFPQNHRVLLSAAKFYILVDNKRMAIDLLRKDYNLFRNNQTLKLLEQLEKSQKEP